MLKRLWLAAAVVGAGAYIALPDIARAQQSELTVTPSSGPVGTAVVLEGKECNNPGHPAYLVYQNGEEGAATVGADTVSINIPVDEEGQFRVTYVIPPEFAPGSLQGRGGGPLQPGVYFFVSRPVLCQAKFLVTSADLPDTGGWPQDRDGFPVSRLAAVMAGSIILLLGLATIRPPRQRK
jgi:hypothetical protein